MGYAKYGRLHSSFLLLSEHMDAGEIHAHPNPRSQLNNNCKFNMTPPLRSTCSSRFPRICLRSHSRRMRRRSLLRIAEGQCHKPRPAYRYHITSEFPIRFRSLVVDSFDRLCYVAPKSRSSFISSLLAYPTVGLSDFGGPGGHL